MLTHISNTERSFHYVNAISTTETHFALRKRILHYGTLFLLFKRNSHYGNEKCITAFLNGVLVSVVETAFT